MLTQPKTQYSFTNLAPVLQTMPTGPLPSACHGAELTSGPLPVSVHGGVVLGPEVLSAPQGGVWPHLHFLIELLSAFLQDYTHQTFLHQPLCLPKAACQLPGAVGGKEKGCQIRWLIRV